MEKTQVSTFTQISTMIAGAVISAYGVVLVAFTVLSY